MTENKDIMNVIMKMAEKKDDFIGMLENLQTHQETMNNLVQHYQEGDWIKMQVLIREMVEKYDTTGYAKKASFLIDAG